MQKTVSPANHPEPPKNKRTVSLSDRVSLWADEMCDKKGYDNFSAYVADLIRRDRFDGPELA